MKNEPGYVRLTLAQTYELGSRARPCLDGLAAGVIFDQTRDGPRAMREVPVALTQDGVPLASSMIITGAVDRSWRTVTRAPTRIARDPNFMEMFTDGVVNWSAKTAMEPGRGKFQSEMNSYTSLSVGGSIWFLFRGDVDRMREVFANVVAIGARRFTGGGRLESVEVSALPWVTNPLFGIVDESSTHLLRPVPQRLEQSLPRGLRMLRGSREGWRNCYRDSAGHEECCVPITFPALLADADFLRVLVGRAREPVSV